MRHRGKRAVPLLLLLAGAGLAFGLWGLHCQSRNPDDPVQATAKAARRDFESTVLATGAVRPQVGAEVRVGARISGKVEHLHANIGDVVKKGQVIAELEKADLEARVAQRRAEMQMAEAKLSALKTLRPGEIEKVETDVAQCRATLTLAGKELLRQDDLLSKDFTSQQARDHAQERLAVAEAKFASADKALELAITRFSEDLKQARAGVGAYHRRHGG